MPPKRQALPDNIEGHPTDANRVRCKICIKVNVGSTWFGRKGISRHLQSAAHSANSVHLQQHGEQLAEYETAGEASLTLPDFEPPREFYDSKQSAVNHFNYLDVSAFSFSAGVGEQADDPDRLGRLRADLEALFLEEEPLAGGVDNHNDASEAELLTDPWSEGFTPPINPTATVEDIQERLFEVPRCTDWSPYQSKVMFLLDLLDNLPRLRLSDAHMRLILWVMKEAGCVDVPSFYALRKTQEQLRMKMAARTHQYRSQLGNIFYMNNIAELVAKDLSNPLISERLHWYPEQNDDGKVSEAWHADRWVKELPSSKLSPMYAQGSKHYYVGEIAQTLGKDLVVLLKWVVRNGELTADAHPVDIQAGIFHVNTSRVVQVKASSLRRNFFDIRPDKENFTLQSHQHLDSMPNPLRELARGDELYRVQIQAWGDDVSGNKSKQYNLHNNIYITNSNLPHRLLQQEYFVKFVSTSPHASVVEQMAALVQQVAENNQDPIRCFNAATGAFCRILIDIECLPADNPQQADEASHIGLGGNLFCRRCKVGGVVAELETDEGYSSLFKPGLPRTKEDTKADILQQLRLACQGVEARVIEHQRATGTKDKILQYWIPAILAKSKEVRVDFRRLAKVLKVRESRSRFISHVEEEVLQWARSLSNPLFNALFTLDGLCPNLDSPVETLHTISLGTDKYGWAALHQPWGKTMGLKHDLLAARLQSADTDGLTIPPMRARYMLQYRNGLIGKHFKTLRQTICFQLRDDLTTPDVARVLKASGFLGALLWYPEIDDMDSYLADLRILIDNLLDAFVSHDPTRVLEKAKLHILTHIPEDIRRFGPSVRFATEIFECFNAVFRLCSILSNHQASSRDIAIKMAEMDRMKQLISGTFWIGSALTSQEDVLCQASLAVRGFLDKTPTLQRQLGWTPRPSHPRHGEVGDLPSHKRNPREWHETEGSQAIIQQGVIVPTCKWVDGSNVAAQTGDICRVRSWVGYHGQQGLVEMGRIKLILKAENQHLGKANEIIIVERFTVLNLRHPNLDMPTLLRELDEEKVLIAVDPKAILFIFNAQHDCFHGNCPMAPIQKVSQERIPVVDKLEMGVEHTDNWRYVVNMHALHNANLLRKVLPRHLTEPRPHAPERTALHSSLAAGLRVSGPAKRAESAAKAAATRARKRVGQGRPPNQTAEESGAEERTRDGDEDEDEDGDDGDDDDGDGDGGDDEEEEEASAKEGSGDVDSES